MQDPEIAIGYLARRSGLAVSAIRYYETRGLLHSERNAGGQRRFRRSDIRRMSFVRISQGLGFSIDEIRDLLQSLPAARTPSPGDWAGIAEVFRERLNQRIETLETLRDNLDGCIGCGCLSLKNCALYNPDDRAASAGSGPRYLMGDKAQDFMRGPATEPGTA